MISHPKCSFPDELNSLCLQIEDKAIKNFDEIIKKTNINLNQNKEYASEYYSLVKSNDKIHKQVKRLRFWRWFLIIFLVFPFVLMTKAARKKQALLDKGEKSEKEVQDKLNEQLAYFIPEISYDLCFKKTIGSVWEDIKLDIYHDDEAFETWIPLLPKLFTKDSCITTLLSGKLFNNPFLIYNYKNQIWQPHVYTGSVPVSYTTRENGQTVTRTEIVVATETLPEPVWLKGTQLAYHFDKAAKLCFTNFVSKHEFKKWNKKQQLPLENKEFNKLFQAVRNNETDYRVLFTPLAQENYVKLLKQQRYNIEKNGEVTIIQLPDNNRPYLDVTPNEAFSYDLETWKNNYAKWTKTLVRNIGLLSLPIANIPLYTHFETKVVPDTEQDIASFLQVQDNLAHLFDLLGLWKNYDTDVIFHPLSTKTKKIGPTEFSLTQVRCDYFYPLHKVITKPAMSMHRGMVMVPIHVIEYLPRHQTLTICQSTNLKCSTKEEMQGNMLLHRGQLMFLANKGEISQHQIDTLKQMLSKKKA